MRVLGCVAMAMLMASDVTLAATLRAGVAKLEITPPIGESMWGYESRTKPAIGTLDPLEARVLVLQAGDSRIGLVTVDLGRVFGPASLDRLRTAARSYGIACLLVVRPSDTYSGIGASL
jgi:hypothetical protein